MPNGLLQDFLLYAECATKPTMPLDKFDSKFEQRVAQALQKEGLEVWPQYEAAGFPTINKAIQPVNLKKIIFTWIVATSLISVMIPLFLTKLSWFFFVVVFVMNLLFIGIFTMLSFGKSAETNLTKSFISINIYMMVFMLMLITYNLAL